MPKGGQNILPLDLPLPDPAQLSAFSELQNDEILLELSRILHTRSLRAVFQPIIDLKRSELIGYEGLIRGPEGSPLHSPFHLFNAAREHKLTALLEKLCREIILARFVELALPGKIFINISPECLIEAGMAFEKMEYLEKIALAPNRIVLELTENQATQDYQQMRDVLRGCRAIGFQIAIDDLGEGFSSLRLWSEIKPDFVKIDMHFIQGIDRDPVKLQFVQSIQLIAGKSGTITIAEGIETPFELQVLQELGVACGQGYHIARPDPQPASAIDAELVKRLELNAALVRIESTRGFNMPTALTLLRIVPVLAPDMSTNQVYELLAADASLEVLPVVKDGAPVGLINRHQFIDRLARPFQRELFGKRSCTVLMTPDPLIVDKKISLQELSLAIVASETHHLSNGFVITDSGHYIGIGSSQDVMREITQMQIIAARYANPLTQLPGNVPINEEIDRRVASDKEFYVCYCDIDHFKPFNDVYGYRRGDDVIRLTGNILAQHCVAGVDFLGHVGGDDFIILFGSTDWEIRCQAILQSFSEAIPHFYNEEDRARDGYVSEDRRGNQVFHPLASLSLGVVKVDAGRALSSYQIAAAAAEAKKQSKTVHGNSLFVERREIR
ncbi:MAG: GGDEF domain-containing protein [Burkholderiales bacterium]|nr:GGDEF domain-containing protein [Burkholderiales bacterium]